VVSGRGGLSFLFEADEATDAEEFGEGGEEGVEFLEEGQGFEWGEAGAAESAGEDIGQAGEWAGVEDIPMGEPRWGGFLEEDAGGISLGGVVGARLWFLGGGVDGFFPGDGFVVDEAIDGEGEAADIGVEEDDSAIGMEGAVGFVEEGGGGLEVVEDVDEEEVGEGLVGEGEVIAVAGEVNPGVREEVGTDGIGDDCLEVTDAGADFGDGAWGGGVEVLLDFAIEGGVDGLEGGFTVPGDLVALDFDLMLLDGGGHQMNLRRRAAKRTMRRRSHPWRQRWILVSP
jgi:hypothetical protein